MQFETEVQNVAHLTAKDFKKDPNIRRTRRNLLIILSIDLV